MDKQEVDAQVAYEKLAQAGSFCRGSHGLKEAAVRFWSFPVLEAAGAMEAL